MIHRGKVRAFPVPSAFFGVESPTQGRERFEEGNQRGGRSTNLLYGDSDAIHAIVCGTCYTCSIIYCLMYSEKYIIIL
jgi:hypothetical protein